MKIFVYQNETFSHSWFLPFDHKFKSNFPAWFLRWWDQHGLVVDLLLESLQTQVVHFNQTKYQWGTAHIPFLLLFISKYKVS